LSDNQIIQKFHDFRGIVAFLFEFEINIAFHDHVMLIVSQVIDLEDHRLESFVRLAIFGDWIFDLHIRKILN